MKLVLVVPCFNEASRLDCERFRTFATTENTDFLFVDDGSTDGTKDRLKELEARCPQRIHVLALATNVGKGEAVRQGLLQALEAGPDLVGFLDADLATPLAEIPGFVRVFEDRPKVMMVIGARVKLMGRHIRRRKWRHYLGRVIATFASMVLGLSIYDTQCGAKLFRVRPELRLILRDPFVSRWIFDVELIARHRQSGRQSAESEIEESIYELPLSVWHDVAGSKVTVKDGLRAFGELAQIYRRYH